MSDQGREFVNRLNEGLLKLRGTDHKITSTYHPWSNGLDERTTLSRALMKFFNDNQNDFNEKDRVMMNICDQVKAQAKQNIDKAQERQKKSYDAKHQPLRFKEGNTLLLRNLQNEARKRSQTRVCVVRSLYHQQGVTKGSLQAPKRRRY